MLYALAIVTFVICGFLPGVLAFFVARLIMPLCGLVLFFGLTYQLFPYADQLMLLAAMRWETVAPWYGTWLVHGLVLVLSVLGGCLMTLLALFLAVVAAVFCLGPAFMKSARLSTMERWKGP